MSCNCLWIFRLPVTRKKNGVVLLRLHFGLAFAWEEDIAIDSGSKLPSYTTGPNNHQRATISTSFSIGWPIGSGGQTSGKQRVCGVPHGNERRNGDQIGAQGMSNVITEQIADEAAL
ncbi:hypothetical protein DAPPUDRAFT_248459 [Daphnia pulex]|uniref:Uncharacterized protein n=1 Tax=Daphnia pulex TaxID=6669 RepID=E9GUQ0_DAPPU|nr:hypothetical protein DAPPUDRAFT_248459 [Daphnia pulex]|eukprot:EFX76902.1 hypothetical protein DAPPUDRAFT_248459 [Daphnia pulex]